MTRSPRLSRSVAALLLGLVVAGPAAAACPDGGGLTLLHFNDFHGQIGPEPTDDGTGARGGIARLATAVERVRAEDPARPVVLLFAGDLLQGTLTSSLFLGIPDITLFGRMGVDAAVMGNHELDDGQDVFRRLVQHATFPILTANVLAQPEPFPTRSTLLIAKPGGPTLGILGLTTAELTTATHPRNVAGIQVTDPEQVARERVPELRGQADLVVVLSHLGLAEDRRLASEVPGIDLIVGGHNHFVLDEPVMVGEVPILQAGERGRWLGRLDIACRDGRPVRTGYRLMAMDASVTPDPEIAAEVDRIVDQAEAGLSEVVGRTEVELSAARELIRRTEAVFGDYVADLAREITRADIALFNAGSFRASIPVGDVTLKQIYQAFPFRNELVVGGLTGAQLTAVLRHSAALDPNDNPGGFLQVSGVSYQIAGRELVAVSVGGEPIQPERVYRVVVPDFLAAGGDGYDELARMSDEVMTGRIISDMLVDAIRTSKAPLAPRPDGRIQRATP